MQDGIRGRDCLYSVYAAHTHIHTCDDAFEQTSIVNNLKSARAELFQTCGHFHSWRQGISSVRFVVQIPFFSKFLRVWKPTQERKAKAKRDEWDVYTPTVIMTHDGSITPLTVTSSNYNNRGNWVKHTETQDELVSLCYSDVNYDTCWQLIWEEKPQIWQWIPRAWETTVAVEHTHTDVQSLAHSCMLCTTLRRRHTELLSLREGDALLKHSFTNCLPADYTTTDCLQQILELFSSFFFTEKWEIESSWDSQMLRDLEKPPGCQCQL